MHIGSSAGDSFAGMLPSSGPTTVRVYMMRSAARRNEAAVFRLSVSVAGLASHLPSEPRPPAAGRPPAVGRPSATANIPCARFRGQPTAQCASAVYRSGNGNATMITTFPGGGRRTIHWSRGRPTSSDGQGALRFSRNGDITMITIGAERFEVVDAFIFGG
jgi:hypothetical protein